MVVHPNVASLANVTRIRFEARLRPPCFARTMPAMSETFRCRLEWTGAAGGPLAGANFSRDLQASFDGIDPMPMSAAPTYQGDATRLNPEQLFVASLAACQALSYLFLAARNHIAVQAYRDDAEGTLAIADRKMRMTAVALRPTITLVAGSDESKARLLVQKAHETCFIANSITAHVTIEPNFQFGEARAD